MAKQGQCGSKRSVEQQKCFEEIKVVVGRFFLIPRIRKQLVIALLFPNRSKDKQEELLESMVKGNAKFCLDGDPEMGMTAEHQCYFLVEMVDDWPHARPALELAVEKYRKAGKPMPLSLQKWVADRGAAPPKQRGPRKFKQHWTRMLDQYIGMAIYTADIVRRHRGWDQKLPIGRPYSSDEEAREHLSICLAVFEVFEELFGNFPECHLPTYNVVWNAWTRYKSDVLEKGKSRPGLSLLTPQELEDLLNPPGIDTAELNPTSRKRSAGQLAAYFLRGQKDDQ